MPEQGLVFISAKSEDYGYAEEVFRFLAAHGVRTFFSPVSLSAMRETDYRRAIDHALEEADHLIVVCSSRVNVTSSWVEAEWGAFINERRSRRKSGNLITVLAGGMAIHELPISLRQYEVIFHSPENFPKLLPFLGYAEPRVVAEPEKKEEQSSPSGWMVSQPPPSIINAPESTPDFWMNGNELVVESEPADGGRKQASPASPRSGLTKFGLIAMGLAGLVVLSLLGLYVFFDQIQHLFDPDNTPTTTVSPGVVPQVGVGMNIDEITEVPPDEVAPVVSMRISPENADQLRLLAELIPTDRSLRSLTFSPDGTLLAAGGEDKRIHIWRVDGFELLATLEGHEHYVLDLAFSSDVSLLGSASADHTIRIWNTADWTLNKVLSGHTNFVNSLAFYPGGDLLVSCGSDYNTNLWRVSNGSLLSTRLGHDNAVTSVDYSDDGSMVVDGGHDHLLRVMSGEDLAVLRQTETRGDVRDVDLSSDNQMIATAMGNQTVTLWDVNLSQSHEMQGHTDGVKAVEFSPDGSLLASGGYDEQVIVWDVAKRSSLMTIHSEDGMVYDVVFSPDGTLLASVLDGGAVRIWSIP